MESIVNYIKDGKEIKKKIDTVDCLVKDEDLFEKNRSLSDLKIKDDIEYVDFKNFSLSEICDISSNGKTLCILDNCSINDVYYPVLHLNLGNFQIINPKFAIKKIKLNGTEDVSMYFDNKDCFEIESSCHFNKYGFWGDRNLEIYSNYSVEHLISSATQVKLNGLFEFSTLELSECEKVIIGNNEQFTKIKLNLPFLSTIVIQTEELILNNCLIINDSEEWLAINYEKLIGNNFLIKSKGDICINGYIIPKTRNEQGYIEITIEDIVKDNFLGTLYGIRRKAEHSVKNKADNLMPQKFGSHILSEIDKLNDEKSKTEQKITNLKENYETAKELKNKKLIKQLRKETISNLDI